MLLLAMAAGVTVLWLWPPGSGMPYPPCPTRAWLGFYCPGCGSTRALGALLQGRLEAAWSFNPAMVLIGVPAIAWFAGTALVAAVRNRWPRPGAALPTVAGWAILALLLAYSVLRNVPGEALEWLRPPSAVPSGDAQVPPPP